MTSGMDLGEALGKQREILGITGQEFDVQIEKLGELVLAGMVQKLLAAKPIPNGLDEDDPDKVAAYIAQIFTPKEIEEAYFEAARELGDGYLAALRG